MRSGTSAAESSKLSAPSRCASLVLFTVVWCIAPVSAQQPARSGTAGSNLEALPGAGIGAAGGGSHLDAYIAGRVGTPGFGVEAAKLFGGHLAVRAGANFFNFSVSKTQSNIDFNAKLKIHSFSAVVDFFPGNRGSFHLTGGIMTNPATVTATGKPSATGFDINGVTYTAAQVGTLTGEAKYSGVLPYFGLGFGTPARNGGALKFLFDLGVAIGKPKLSLVATNPSNIPNLATDVEAQRVKTENDVQKYAKIYPVISLGLAYRF